MARNYDFDEDDEKYIRSFPQTSAELRIRGVDKVSIEYGSGWLNSSTTASGHMCNPHRA
jgi:hypothetical protein